MKKDANMSMKLINEGQFLFIGDRLRNDLLKAINTYAGKKKNISQRRGNDSMRMEKIIRNKSLNYHEIKEELEKIAKKMETGVTGRSKLKAYVLNVFKRLEYQEGEYLRVQNLELDALVRNHPIISDFLKEQVETEKVDTTLVGVVSFVLREVCCLVSRLNTPEKIDNGKLLEQITALEEEKDNLTLEVVKLTNEIRRLKYGATSPVDDYYERYSKKSSGFF